MRKTSLLMTAATAVALFAAPMAQAQILGGSGGATGGLGGTVGGLTGQAGGGLSGSGQVNPDTDGLTSRLQSTTERTRERAGDAVQTTRDTTAADGQEEPVDGGCGCRLGDRYCRLGRGQHLGRGQRGRRPVRRRRLRFAERRHRDRRGDQAGRRQRRRLGRRFRLGQP
jgi:hypothetical protein